MSIRTSDRFWSKVQKTDGCWQWTAYIDALGYGRMSFKGEHWKVHRFSWFLAHGRIPRSLDVLHTCDNRSCVNPNHLFLGTQQDNIQDMIKKGRNKNPIPRYGEKNNQARLTVKQVKEIRERYKYGNGYVLAREFGVSRMTITRTVQRQCWRNV
jgi:hypothetical protein